MARLTWMQRLYWNHLSPASERELFRLLLANPVGSILEIGMGDGSRAKKILQVAQVREGVPQMRYVVVDPFESASDSSQHLSLKSAHRLLSEFGVRSSLIPGDPGLALARVAHSVGASDLIVINGGFDVHNPQSGSIAPWLNRIAHAESMIVASKEVGGKLERLVSLPQGLAARRAA